MTQRPHENRDPLWMKIAFGLVVLGFILCFGAMSIPIIMTSPLPVGDIMAAFRFLPSDEAMIENFHKHRMDFERLMQIYQASGTLYIELQRKPEVKHLMNRIGSEYMASDGVVWCLPHYDGRIYQPTSFDKSTFGVQKLAAIITDTKSEPSRTCRYYSNGVIFEGIHAPVLRLKTRTRVAKQFYYIPGIPKTENSVLTGPGAFRKGPLCRTLNTYPSDFMCHDCVAYREIEPHWFIRLTQE
jgi:hypothetical protein